MSDGLEELVRTAIRTECDDLRKFVDRRIAELSMERSEEHTSELQSPC